MHQVTSIKADIHTLFPHNCGEGICQQECQIHWPLSKHQAELVSTDDKFLPSRQD